MISGHFALTANGSPCQIVAFVLPAGQDPVNGPITAKVWVESTPVKLPVDAADEANNKANLFIEKRSEVSKDLLKQAAAENA